MSDAAGTHSALGQEPRPLGTWERRIVVGADRFIYWLTRHWLLVFTIAVFSFLAIAFASPVLIATGHEGLGRFIFRAYHRVCHQRPERSFFVLGQQVAYCQRDVGTYAGLTLGGILFALGRRRVGVRRPRFYLWVFVLPVAIDGLTQLFGLRQSTWGLRLGTGTWFGIGTAFFVYPVLQKAMADTRLELEERFGAGLGRLRPSGGA